MRVLVTGGAGFIGSHIVDQLLQRGHEPFVLDNLCSGSRKNLPADVPLFEVDIRDEAGVRRVFDEVQPQAVSHQAAQMSVSRSVREPVFDAQVNVVGMLQVLQEATRVGTERIVFASSGGALYGDVTTPVEEDHPCEPIAPYGISKLVGEHYLRFFTLEHGIQTVALRYTNVYGPRQNPHGEAGVVAIFSLKMLAAEQATINGDGLYVRDYVYVTDVARANVLALESNLTVKHMALNIGTGIGTDVNQLAALILENCAEARRRQGRTEPIPEPRHGEARAGDLRSSMVSSKRAGQVLGWQPEVDLDHGLRDTVDWFAEHAL